jgi:hypothetical protein
VQATRPRRRTASVRPRRPRFDLRRPSNRKRSSAA